MSVCPRCQGMFSASDVGQGVLRCDGCGTFLCEPDARQKLCRFLKIDEAIWHGLLSSGGRGAPCSRCATRMALVNLKGVTVDGCSGCGSLLLDPGELKRLTGRDEGEVPTPSVAPPALRSPMDAAPGPGTSSGLGRVYVPATHAVRGFFDGAPWVQFRQERPQVVAMTFTVDTGSRYVVSTPAGAGHLQRQEGAAAMLARMFLAPFVTQRFAFSDTRDNPMLILDRHFEKLVLSRLDVFLDDAGDPGQRLGSVERNLRLIDTRYELKDARGVVFGRLVRPMTSLWQFHLETATGATSGAVAKQWSGFVSEFFTDADDYGVDFGAAGWTVEQRAVITAAALAIDLDHFERGQSVRRTSIFELLD